MTDPPPHCLVRTGGLLWTPEPAWEPAGTWWASTTRDGYLTEPWTALASGAHGPVEVLVPLAWPIPDAGEDEKYLTHLAAAVTEPVAAMMAQLASAAAAGVERVIRQAYTQGQRTRHSCGDPGCVLRG